MPFLLGSALVYVPLSRERSPRLAYTAGILLGTGLVGLTAVQGSETTQFGLAQDGRFDLVTLADAIDDLTIPPAIAMIVMLLVGASSACWGWRWRCGGPALSHVRRSS